MAKPDDFIVWFNGIPISLNELEKWKPGITNMGMVEALEYIPMFLGVSDEPIAFADLGAKFEATANPREGEQGFELFEKQEELEIEFQLLLTRLSTCVDNGDDTQALEAEVVAKRTQLQQAHADLLMIKKLASD